MNESDPTLLALSRIATPDVELRGQVQHRAPDETSETRLFRWVLLSAIADHLESLQPSRNQVIQKQRLRIGAEARAWFDGAGGASVSFEEACAAFSMTPAEMRRRIATLRQTHARGERWIALAHVRSDARL